MITWSIALTVSSVTGAILNARGSIKGFYVWVPANTGWIVYDIIIGEYAQAFLFLVYTLISLYGIRQWRKLRKEGK